MKGFRCVILAGGRGERLYPVTATRPKPLCPIGGASCLERCIRAALDAGAVSVTVAACCLAEQIERHCARFAHKNVRVVRESSPLGTAGCVRLCTADDGALRDSDVLVLSGDGVNDFDLRSFARAHSESGFAATVALVRSPDPVSYGTVTLDGGRITAFTEKPEWEAVFSDTVNAGVYMLSPSALALIPEGKPFDFSKNLFPLMMKRSIAIGGVLIDGYWCDIGNPAALYSCAMRYTGGRSDVDPTVRIPASASVRASVIMENVSVGRKAVIDRSIVCENVTVGENALISAGCVIGGGAVIGANARLNEGVTVAAGAVIGEGSVIVRNIGCGGAKRRLFDGAEGIRGAYGRDFDPADAVLLGTALCGDGTDGGIGVMHDGSGEGSVLASAVACGARFGGTDCHLLGSGFEALCGWCATEYLLKRTVFIRCEHGDSVHVRVFGSDGSPVEADAVKAIESRFASLMFSGASGSRSAGRSVLPHGFDAPLYLYTDTLTARMNGCSGFSAAFDGDGSSAVVLATAFASAGGKRLTDGMPLFRVSEDGADCSVTDENGIVSGFWRLVCLYLREKSESSKSASSVFLPGDAPEAVGEYLKSVGVALLGEGKPDPTLEDACMLCASVLSLCARKRVTLASLLSDIPELYIRSVLYECDESEKASRIAALCAECGGPARFGTGHGTVRITPSRYAGFRIIAEAASAEYAEELCDFGIGKLEESPNKSKSSD